MCSKTGRRRHDARRLMGGVESYCEEIGNQSPPPTSFTHPRYYIPGPQTGVSSSNVLCCRV
jgi:hypothetical protein